jgi:hypothetical protein
LLAELFTGQTFSDAVKAPFVLAFAMAAALKNFSDHESLAFQLILNGPIIVVFLSMAIISPFLNIA